MLQHVSIELNDDNSNNNKRKKMQIDNYKKSKTQDSGISKSIKVFWSILTNQAYLIDHVQLQLNFLAKK